MNKHPEKRDRRYLSKAHYQGTVAFQTGFTAGLRATPAELLRIGRTHEGFPHDMPARHRGKSIE